MTYNQHLSEPFSGSWYIHNVVQPPLLLSKLLSPLLLPRQDIFVQHEALPLVGAT